MPTYHYYAVCTCEPDKVVQIDGIAKMQRPLETMEDYRRLKDLVSQDVIGLTGIIIQSLSDITERTS